MGWVTLSLRTMEDKTLVNQYELELIQLSRKRMQLLRRKNAEEADINNQRSTALKAIRSTTGVDEISDENAAIVEALGNIGEDGKSSVEGDYNGKTKEQLTEALTLGTTKGNNATSKYEQQSAIIKNYYDSLLNDVEEQCTDEENQLDMEQTEIETRLSAIRQELEAVKQQVSADIQSTTIKLG